MLVAKKEYTIYAEPIKQPNKKKVIKTKRRVVNKTMYFGIIALFFLSSFFILNRYASITQIRYEITERQNHIRELELEKIDLETKLVALENSSNISERAQNNLGMVYPEEDQIVYITVENINETTQDHISLAQRIKEIFSIFSSIF